ncbi:hypothetical protein D9M72_321640 [compost metagenome]
MLGIQDLVPGQRRLAVHGTHQFGFRQCLHQDPWIQDGPVDKPDIDFPPGNAFGHQRRRQRLYGDLGPERLQLGNGLGYIRVHQGGRRGDGQAAGPAALHFLDHPVQRPDAAKDLLHVGKQIVGFGRGLQAPSYPFEELQA